MEKYVSGNVYNYCNVITHRSHQWETRSRLHTGVFASKTSENTIGLSRPRLVIVRLLDIELYISARGWHRHGKRADPGTDGHFLPRLWWEGGLGSSQVLHSCFNHTQTWLFITRFHRRGGPNHCLESWLVPIDWSNVTYAMKINILVNFEEFS